MPDVTEVSSGSDHVLDEGSIDQVAGNSVNNLAEGSGEAVGDIGDTHVGTTDRGPVANLTLNITALYDVTSKKGTLRKSHYIELIGICKGFVSLKLLACFPSLVGEIVSHRGDGAVANLNTLCIIVGIFGNLFSETVHAGVYASITETMENGGRNCS